LLDKPGHYRLRYDEPVFVDDFSDSDLEIVPLTTRYLAILEAAIRENPDQWLWYHDRWKQLRIPRSQFTLRK
jgi:KDO2-lipid IV(A) lauroyltransferase